MVVVEAEHALRGRRESFWSSEQVCVVRLVDARTVIAKLVYTATNLVKRGLALRAT